MRGWTVQLFTRGLPWVALLIVTAFGLHQLQLRKSAQSVSRVPLSATVPRAGFTPPAPPAPASVEQARLPEALIAWYAASESVRAQPPVVGAASALSRAHLRTTLETERTQALLATARARARAHEAARAELTARIAAEQTARVAAAAQVQDAERVRWALRLEDVESGDDVRRIAALRAASQSEWVKAARQLVELVGKSDGHRAAAAELLAAMPPNGVADVMLASLLARLPGEQQATVVRRIGLKRFTGPGTLTDQLFRKDAGAAAHTIAAMAVEQQAELDAATRARLRAAALGGVRKGRPQGVAAGARLLALAHDTLDESELLVVRRALKRLGRGAASYEAHAALLTVMAHKLEAPQRAGAAGLLRRHALDAMASDSAVVRAAGHRLAVSLSAEALFFDPAAPLATRRARLKSIEAAWR